VFVLDATGALKYRGAIDDHETSTRVRRRYLEDALEALIGGDPVPVKNTRALGCTIHLSEVARLGEVTYAEHIAPILQENCQTCHRPRQVAPFSLMNYRQAKAWAEEIRAYTGARLMPPWKAAPGFGEFKNERGLSESEINLIDRWVAEGMPKGDLELMPPPREFPEEWILGEPDLTVTMPEEYVIGPEGEDDYRHFVIPTDLNRDVYVEAIDVRPGNLETVHHVIVYVDTRGKARRLDAADPGPGYTNFGGPGFDPVSMLGGWAPGTYPNVTPPGSGAFLPKGSDVVLQVHYFRTGVEERDRTRVGLYFSEHPDPKRIHMSAALNREFKIPPGENRYRVTAERPVREDVYAVSVYPHMHLLGEEIQVTAELPDGTVIPFIWIKNWDFNWQGDYHFREPIFLPQGSRIRVVAYYDNSADNPNNPHHPPKPVGWGEKTTDEMCLAFVSYLKASEYDPEAASQTALR
jgi:mono/diheme cytochrome c family protein